jgi:hypothetical protein
VQALADAHDTEENCPPAPGTPMAWMIQRMPSQRSASGRLAELVV